MIVYEVELEVHHDLRDEYPAWLRGHVAQMLALPGFVDAQLLQLETDAAEAPVFLVQYRLRDRAALQAYFDTHAAAMRAEGLARFGDRVTARRRILQPL